MPYIDVERLFSDEQAITADAASTNSYDAIHTDGDRNFPPYVVFVVTEDFAGATATLDIDWQTDDNSSFSSATSIPLAEGVLGSTLVTGYELAVKVPRGKERHNRIYYTAAGADFTAGAITAYVAEDAQLWQ
jgi:hypothetical protein